MHKCQVHQSFLKKPLQWPFCNGCVPESLLVCPSSICWPNNRHPLPPSASCLAASHQRRRRLMFHFTLGITVLFWLFIVFSLSFPFRKDACCQGPTTSKRALSLPAPGSWLQPAARAGLPGVLPLCLRRRGGKLSWEDDTVGNRSVLLSLERFQIYSLSSPTVLLGPILSWLKSWNVTKNRSKPIQRACLKWSKWSKTYSTTNNTWLLPARMLFCYQWNFEETQRLQLRRMLAITLLLGWASVGFHY